MQSLSFLQLYISLAGILSIGLAILFSYGIAMYFGFIYGPIHALMPFLLLGKFLYLSMTMLQLRRGKYTERNFQCKRKFNILYFIQFCIKCNQIRHKQQIIYDTIRDRIKVLTSPHVPQSIDTSEGSIPIT